eukprot:4141313-Pleurochrysis_carterae.AAC.1
MNACESRTATKVNSFRSRSVFTTIYADGGICEISLATRSDASDRQLCFTWRAGCHECENHDLYGAPRHIRMQYWK